MSTYTYSMWDYKWDVNYKHIIPYTVNKSASYVDYFNNLEHQNFNIEYIEYVEYDTSSDFSLRKYFNSWMDLIVNKNKYDEYTMFGGVPVEIKSIKMDSMIQDNDENNNILETTVTFTISEEWRQENEKHLGL